MTFFNKGNKRLNNSILSKYEFKGQIEKIDYADISLIGMDYIYILLQFLSSVSPLCLCSFIMRKQFQQKFVTFQTSTWVLQFNQYAIQLIPKFIFILSEVTHILVMKGLNFEQNFRDFFFSLISSSLLFPLIFAQDKKFYYPKFIRSQQRQRVRILQKSVIIVATVSNILWANFLSQIVYINSSIRYLCCLEQKV